MAMFDDVMMVSSDDDDELEILSENIVPAKSSMELTPDEQRRLLEQLNLDPNSNVKIRVSGEGGSQRNLLDGRLGVAQCKVFQEGKVIRQKSLLSQKIFGPAKRSPHDAALAAKFSEILTISDDEPEEELQLVPELSPFKKVKLRKKKKSYQVVGHLVQQQRVEGGIQEVLELVGCVAQTTETTDETVSHFKETFADADTSKLTDKSIAVSDSPDKVTEEINTVAVDQFEETFAETDTLKVPDKSITSSKHLNIELKENHTVVTEAPAVQIEIQESEPALNHLDLVNQELSIPAILLAETIDDTTDHNVPEAPVLCDSDSRVLTSSELHTSSPEPSSQDDVDVLVPIEVHENCVESINKDESKEKLNINKPEVQMDKQESSTLTDTDYCDNVPTESEVNEADASVEQAVFESSRHQAALLEECSNVDLIPSTDQEPDVIAGQNDETPSILTCFQDPLADLVFPEADVTLPNESPEDYLFQEKTCRLKQAQPVQPDSSSMQGQVTSGPPSVSSINLTAGHQGKLFLPAGQLSQLLLPGTAVHDVMSVCTDLKEDLMWNGWTVTHVSLAAVVKVLDKYGDMYEVREDLIVKQQLADLEKMVTRTASADERSKKDLLSVMGLCRVEEVDAILEETNHRREVARSSMRLRSGSRRKQSPGEAFGGKRVRAGNLPRNTTWRKSGNKGKVKRRK